MFRKLGSLIQFVGVGGIITGFHFYDKVEGFKVDLFAIFSLGLIGYVFVVRKYVKVQKARELDEDKAKVYTTTVQLTKTIRNLILVGGSSLVLLLLGDTLHNLGITLALCSGAYVLGGAFKVYDTTREKETI